jgi:hypothetical protein
MTVMKNYEASWDDESSHVEDLRLSVASLLRGDDDVWEEAEEMIPEGHSAVLVEGLDSKRTSRCWGLDVMRISLKRLAWNTPMQHGRR